MSLALPLVLLMLATSAERLDPARAAPQELEPLAARLAAYFEARAAGAGVPAARAEVAAALDRLRAERGGRDPLAAPRDIERAVRMARTPPARGLEAGRVVEDRLEGGSFGTVGLEWAYRLPKDYDPEAATYPLVLSLPDRGQRPAEHLRASWVERAVLDGAVLVCPALPGREADWPRVMVAGRPGGLCHVLTSLRVAGERFAVDFDRVFVVGHGASVPAALAAGDTVPQRLAGVVGRGGDPDPGLGPDNFGALPVYFASGGAHARAFAAASEAAGGDSGGGSVTLAASADEEDVWGWMSSRRRTARPARVRLLTGQPFPTRTYWMRVAPVAPGAHATAILDRGTNTVSIAGAGVSHVTLYLDDVLLDLDRPVRARCNGVESETLVSRSLWTTLELLEDGTNDPGCVFTAEVTFDLRRETAAGRAEPAGPDPSFERRLAATSGIGDRGARVDALFALYEWCVATPGVARPEDVQLVLRRIVRIDPDHANARAALGHVREGGHWFTTAFGLARHRASQDPEEAAARGHVERDGVWMHPHERRLANKGGERDPETGLWTFAADRERLAAGEVRQDLEWVAAEDAWRVDAGQWLVDGEWLDLERATRRRARVRSMWRIPTRDVLLHTTVDRATALRAALVMGCAIRDVRRVFGAEPVLPVPVALLADEEQYDRFAFGDPDGRRPPTHTRRLHVIHHAFFAESRFLREGREERFAGVGVGYWNPNIPHGDAYGAHSARLAAALAYVDALDPSPKAVRKRLSRPRMEGYAEAYEAEKELPAWLRWGGAVYAERYFYDETVDPSIEADPQPDPWWARRWSLENLERLGGLRPLDEVLAFPLDPDAREDGQRLLLEAGLVAAFLVDGDCAAVREAHDALKRALALDRMKPSLVRDLEEALTEHEPELRAFADRALEGGR